MDYFHSQNEKIKTGALNGTHAKPIHLDTLGITNGCIDSKIEGPFYPEFAFNNTYGFQAYSEEVYKSALNNFTKEGGCNYLIDQCRALAISDPQNIGTNQTVNQACALATVNCFTFVQGAFELSQRNVFDIALKKPTVFPPEYMVGYLNQQWVQQHLGVPVNFTLSSQATVDTFFGLTGDPLKVSIDTINRVAAHGIKIALVFGDLDYRCNCTLNSHSHCSKMFKV